MVKAALGGPAHHSGTGRVPPETSSRFLSGWASLYLHKVLGPHSHLTDQAKPQAPSEGHFIVLGLTVGPLPTPSRPPLNPWVRH